MIWRRLYSQSCTDNSMLYSEETSTDYGFGMLYVNNKGRAFEVPELGLSKWHHFCFSIHHNLEKKEQILIANVNGEIKLDQTIKDVTYLEKLTLPFSLTIGKKQDAGRKIGLYGRMADLYIWTRLLTKEEMMSFTNMTPSHHCSLRDINSQGKSIVQWHFC